AFFPRAGFQLFLDDGTQEDGNPGKPFLGLGSPVHLVGDVDPEGLDHLAARRYVFAVGIFPHHVAAFGERAGAAAPANELVLATAATPFQLVRFAHGFEQGAAVPYRPESVFPDVAARSLDIWAGGHFALGRNAAIMGGRQASASVVSFGAGERAL